MFLQRTFVRDEVQCRKARFIQQDSSEKSIELEREVSVMLAAIRCDRTEGKPGRCCGHRHRGRLYGAGSCDLRGKAGQGGHHRGSEQAPARVRSLADLVDLSSRYAFVGRRRREHGRTSDIFAAGNCTNHFNRFCESWVRLESVQNAQHQAKAAGLAIAGVRSPYESVPRGDLSCTRASRRPLL